MSEMSDYYKDSMSIIHKQIFEVLNSGDKDKIQSWEDRMVGYKRVIPGAPVIWITGKKGGIANVSSNI